MSFSGSNPMKPLMDAAESFDLLFQQMEAGVFDENIEASGDEKQETRQLRSSKNKKNDNSSKKRKATSHLLVENDTEDELSSIASLPDEKQTNLSQNNLSSLVDSSLSITLVGKLPDGNEIEFVEKTVAADGDCGFTALGTTRHGMANFLLTLSDKAEAREHIALEIEQQFIDGRIASAADPLAIHFKNEALKISEDYNNYAEASRQAKRQHQYESSPALGQKEREAIFHTYLLENDKPLADTLIKLWNKLQAREKLFKDHCCSKATYEMYIKTRLKQDREYVGQTCLTLYAKENGKTLYIWNEPAANSNKLILADNYVISTNATETLHLVFRSRNRRNVEHFNLLVNKQLLQNHSLNSYPSIPKPDEWQAKRQLSSFLMSEWLKEVENDPEHIIRKHQFNALKEYVLEREQRLGSNKIHAVFERPTGSGKTYIFIKMLEIMKEKGLVLVPTRLLMRQLIEDFENHAPDLVVGVLSNTTPTKEEKALIDKLTREKKYTQLEKLKDERRKRVYESIIKNSDICLMTYHAFVRFIDSIPLNLFDSLTADEGHHLTSDEQIRIIKMIMEQHLMEIRVFTATPIIDNIKGKPERNMYRLLGYSYSENGTNNPITSQTIKEAIDAEDIPPVMLGVIVLKVEDNDNILLTKQAGASDISNLTVERKLNRTAYNNAIGDYILNRPVTKSKLYLRGEYGFAFCAGVNHSEAIAQVLNQIPVDDYDPENILRNHYIENYAREKKVSLVDAKKVIEDPNDVWGFCVAKAVYNNRDLDDEQILIQAKMGGIGVLTGCDEILEGYNDPARWWGIELRPTFSTKVLTQTGGRMNRNYHKNPNKVAVLIHVVPSDMTSFEWYGSLHFRNEQNKIDFAYFPKGRNPEFSSKLTTPPVNEFATGNCVASVTHWEHPTDGKIKMFARKRAVRLLKGTTHTRARRSAYLKSRRKATQQVDQTIDELKKLLQTIENAFSSLTNTQVEIDIDPILIQAEDENPETIVNDMALDSANNPDMMVDENNNGEKPATKRKNKSQVDTTPPLVKSVITMTSECLNRVYNFLNPVFKSNENPESKKSKSGGSDAEPNEPLTYQQRIDMLCQKARNLTRSIYTLQNQVYITSNGEQESKDDLLTSNQDKPLQELIICVKGVSSAILERKTDITKFIRERERTTTTFSEPEKTNKQKRRKNRRVEIDPDYENIQLEDEDDIAVFDSVTYPNNEILSESGILREVAELQAKLDPKKVALLFKWINHFEFVKTYPAAVHRNSLADKFRFIQLKLTKQPEYINAVSPLTGNNILYELFRAHRNKPENNAFFDLAKFIQAKIANSVILFPNKEGFYLPDALDRMYNASKRYTWRKIAIMNWCKEQGLNIGNSETPDKLKQIKQDVFAAIREDNWGCDLLHKLCRIHDKMREKVIKNACNAINDPDENGNMPLHSTFLEHTRQISKDRWVSALKLLFTHGANPNLKNSAGDTPFHSLFLSATLFEKPAFVASAFELATNFNITIANSKEITVENAFWNRLAPITDTKSEIYKEQYIRNTKNFSKLFNLLMKKGFKENLAVNFLNLIRLCNSTIESCNQLKIVTYMSELMTAFKAVLEVMDQSNSSIQTITKECNNFIGRCNDWILIYTKKTTIAKETQTEILALIKPESVSRLTNLNSSPLHIFQQLEEKDQEAVKNPTLECYVQINSKDSFNLTPLQVLYQNLHLDTDKWANAAEILIEFRPADLFLEDLFGQHESFQHYDKIVILVDLALQSGYLRYSKQEIHAKLSAYLWKTLNTLFVHDDLFERRLSKPNLSTKSIERACLDLVDKLYKEGHASEFDAFISRLNDMLPVWESKYYAEAKHKRASDSVLEKYSTLIKQSYHIMEKMRAAVQIALPKMDTNQDLFADYKVKEFQLDAMMEILSSKQDILTYVAPNKKPKPQVQTVTMNQIYRAMGNVEDDVEMEAVVIDGAVPATVLNQDAKKDSDDEMSVSSDSHSSSSDDSDNESENSNSNSSSSSSDSDSDNSKSSSSSSSQGSESDSDSNSHSSLSESEPERKKKKAKVNTQKNSQPESSNNMSDIDSGPSNHLAPLADSAEDSDDDNQNANSKKTPIVIDSSSEDEQESSDDKSNEASNSHQANVTADDSSQDNSNEDDMSDNESHHSTQESHHSSSDSDESEAENAAPQHSPNSSHLPNVIPGGGKVKFSLSGLRPSIRARLNQPTQSDSDSKASDVDSDGDTAMRRPSYISGGGMIKPRSLTLFGNSGEENNTSSAIQPIVYITTGGKTKPADMSQIFGTQSQTDASQNSASQNGADSQNSNSQNINNPDGLPRVGSPKSP